MSNENENKGQEFDPTTSEEFYENLEAAISVEEAEEVPAEEIDGGEEDLPELVFAADLFDATEEELADMASAKDDLGMEEGMDASEEQDEFDVDDEIFRGVDAALIEQIENEFGTEASAKEGFGSVIAGVWGKIPTWTKILASVILAVLLSVIFLFGTKPGRKLFADVATKIMFLFIEEAPEGTLTPVPTEPVGVTPGLTPGVTPGITEPVGPTGEPTGEPTTEPGPTDTPTTEPTISPTPTTYVIPVKDDPNVINILLVGVENIYNARYGRTDAILVASVNKRNGEMKVVSLLRDTYVRLPDGQGDKLNAAFAYYGINGLIETIESNFKVDIDSYATINFTGFEDLIDELGGLRISLTTKESEYLNTTRYISNPEERNTVAGYQMMTGSQVLGYCRVRAVPTANGLKDDYGRTYRQRTVLKALFDKYKEKNFVELLAVMKKCMGYVSAPNDLQPLAADCLVTVMEFKKLDFDTMQIPARGYFSDKDINGKDVLYMESKNIELLQEFLYGE
ncbi:MAG: hypothetical protein E7260_09735 [Lachnospiraceae bacterium]|nr:hypothetical protein [Lachnospiraceae bacterium]